MPVKLDTNVLAFLLVVLILLAIVLALKSKAARFIKILFQFVLGGAFILLFNFLGKYIDLTIPLNPITAFLTGILQIPGFALILIIKYIIYP